MLGEGHLRKIVSEYVLHYRAERNHQSLGNEVLQTTAGAATDNGRIRWRKRLGGVLKYYHRGAA